MNGFGINKAVLNPYVPVAHFRNPVLDLPGAGDAGVRNINDLFQRFTLDKSKRMKQFMEMCDDFNVKLFTDSNHMRNDNGIDIPYIRFKFLLNSCELVFKGVYFKQIQQALEFLMLPLATVFVDDAFPDM